MTPSAAARSVRLSSPGDQRADVAADDLRATGEGALDVAADSCADHALLVVHDGHRGDSGERQLRSPLVPVVGATVLGRLVVTSWTSIPATFVARTPPRMRAVGPLVGVVGQWAGTRGQEQSEGDGIEPSGPDRKRHLAMRHLSTLQGPVGRRAGARVT